MTTALIIVGVLLVAAAAAVGVFLFAKNNPNKVTKIGQVIDSVKDINTKG